MTTFTHLTNMRVNLAMPGTSSRGDEHVFAIVQQMQDSTHDKVQTSFTIDSYDPTTMAALVALAKEVRFTKGTTGRAGEQYVAGQALVIKGAIISRTNSKGEWQTVIMNPSIELADGSTVGATDEVAPTARKRSTKKS